MNLGCISAAIIAAASIVSAKVFFSETFDNENWESTWKVPSNNPNTLGHWEVSAGKFFADEKVNRGLRTQNDMHFYALTAPLKEVFNNEKGDLVVQFSVKNEQNLDCGGAYIKVKFHDIVHIANFLHPYSCFLVMSMSVNSVVKLHTRLCSVLTFVDQLVVFI